MERVLEPKFRRILLDGYRAIVEPGKYLLPVQNNVDVRHLYVDPEGRAKYIINFKAMAPDQVERAVSIFGNDDEVSLELTNGLFLTGSVLKREMEERYTLPLKGERIEVNIDYVLTRENQTVLRITSVRPNTIKNARYLSVADIFRRNEDEQQQTQGELAHA